MAGGDGLKGFPVGGKVFTIDQLSKFSFGGEMGYGAVSPHFELTPDDYKKIKCLSFGSSSNSNGTQQYVGGSDGNTQPYQIPATANFRVIGIFRYHACSASTQQIMWGLGSCTSAPSSTFTTAVPTGFNGTFIANEGFPATPPTGYPSAQMERAIWVPYPVVISSSRYPVLTAVAIAGTPIFGGWQVFGIEG